MELALQEGVDLLGDGVDLDAGALDQGAVGLAGAGGKVDGFAEVARRVGVGDILPHHLQGDIVRLQGCAAIWMELERDINACRVVFTVLPTRRQGRANAVCLVRLRCLRHHPTLLLSILLRFLIEQHPAGARGSCFSICRLNPAASRDNL